MKKPILILIFILCLRMNTVHAQGMNIYGYDEYSRQGMTSNLIRSICRDADGFIWIATEYGLNKYDGIIFKPYLHDDRDSFSVSDNNVHKLMVDKNRTLWLCCINGLQYYDAEKDVFRKIRFPKNTEPHVTDIVELHSGNFWITTAGKGLFELKKGAETAVLLDKLNNKVLSCIHEDSRHNVWIGTINNGLQNNNLFRINPQTGKTTVFPIPSVQDYNINAIAEDNAGRLYLGSSNSVLLYEETIGRFIPLLCESNPRISVRSMLAGKNGKIFVGTEGQGLKYIDTDKKQLFPVENNRLPFDFNKVRIHALMEDTEGSLWLGCFQRGIFRMSYQPAQFDFWDFPGKETKMEGIVTSICKDSEDKVWCSVSGEGIFRFDGKGRLEKHFSQPLTTINLFEDSNHTLWVSAYDKAQLAKMDKNTGQCRYLQIPQSGYIKSIVEDKHKHLYLSTFGSGFIRYNLQFEKWETIETQDKNDFPNAWINVLLCDSKGLIWMGHYTGISCYNSGQNRFIRHNYMDSLSGQIGLSLMEDRAGNIWLGTYNGAFRINLQTGNIRNYTTADGLSNNVICGLIEDENGDIWCSTFQGINQIRVKENKIVNYYSGNGLVDKVYNRGVYYRDKEGIIYFGGNKGITLFSPENISESDYARDILTTNLYIHNQPVTINTVSGGKRVLDAGLTKAKTFRFASGDNTFAFEFSTMDFADPQNIHYEYRLKELGDEWNLTQSGVNRITYNHLPPGKYTLEVRACKYGAYSPVKQLFLKISPPWYQSIYAYAVYFLMFVAVCLLIAWLIDRKRKEEVSEAKLRFFIDISHEIRSPMTLLLNPLEKLMKGNHEAATMKALETMYRNARRILALINQLLDIRKIDKGQMHLKYSESDLVRFIEELMLVFEEQAAARNIRFAFEHPMEELRVWIDRNNFDKVLMNVLSNAFKFTLDNGEINILLTTGTDSENRGTLHDYAEIRVMDSGNGINEDQIEKIFTRFYQGHDEPAFGSMGSGIGLNLSRNLVELHKGSITASNRNDRKGSCFTIRLPLGKNHIRKENLFTNETNLPLIRTLEPFNQPPAAKKKPVRSRTGYKILIVDDEAEVRDLLRQELESAFKIITASNGKEALQLTLSQTPDLIISDIIMPEMDGLTFVRKLRSNSNISHIPVIFLSSKAESEDRMQGLDQGADAYLSKPFIMDELYIVLNNLINNRQLLKGKFSGAQDQQDKIKAVEFKSSDEILMERIMLIINNHLDNPDLNVEMLSAEIGLSRVQLHRKLKEIAGIPASDFIRNIRLKKAAELLKEKKMNISQIAYTVGFANQTHFSSAFKKFYGVSPTEYIAQG